jgi:uncharacterized repeat protein (TIGR01451 family)
VASSTDGRVDTLYLDGRSVNNPATIDQGYAEVEFDVPAAATLLGRYWFNEAPSGQTPDTVFDDQASPVHLTTVVYDANTAWTVDDGHRGLNGANDSHTGIAYGDASGTKYTTNLDGALEATFVTVAEWGTVTSSQRIAGFVVDNGLRIVEFVPISGDKLSLRVLTQLQSITAEWDNVPADSTRRVFHFVYDADNPVDSLRIRLYMDGSLLPPPTLTSGTWPVTTDGLDFSNPNPILLTALNNTPADPTNPLDGTVFYYAVYDGMLSDGDISTDAAALLLDDDSYTPTVAVTPDGAAVLRVAGTDYSQDFAVTNNSTLIDDFDLLGSVGPASSFLSIDSITGTNVTQGAVLDSARLTGVTPSGTDSVTVWYTVASSTDGRVDTLYLRARSITDTTVTDDGYAEVEFDDPGAGGPGNILMIVGSAATPDPVDDSLKAYLESQGLTVWYADDADPRSTYDSIIAANSVLAVYVSPTSGSAAIGTKTYDLPVGVVMANVGSWDNQELSSNDGSVTGTQTDIIDNTHWITQPFSTGLLNVYTADTARGYGLSGFGSGAQILAQVPGAPTQAMLIVYDSAAVLQDATEAPARRVGIFSESEDWNGYTADAKTLIYRSLVWAQSGDPGLPSAGLIGHWTFDEGSGQTATDSSASNNHGTLGPTSSPESGDPTWACSGTALDFDGSDDEVKLSSVAIGDRATWSITAWFKMDPDAADKRTIYGEGNTTQEEYLYLQVREADSTVTFYSEQFPGTVYTQMTGTSNVEDGAWHLVTVVQRSKTDRVLYVDALPEDSSTQDAGTLTFNTASIGYLRTNWVADPFLGTIDEVRIYDYALSTSEIAALNASPPSACGVPAPRLSSEANQTFVVGDPSFAAVVDTIADDDTTPTITDAANLRLRIPAGFNMIWDTTVTTVSIGGAASTKVETALLPYEDGGKTLVLDVNTDFLAGDLITVDGHRFMDFSAVSAADSLDLEVNDDDVVSATDDKTIEIIAETYGVVVTPDGLGSPVVRAPGTDYSQDFYVRNSGNGYEPFDLLGSVGPAGSFLTIDSITGTGVSQGAVPDSAGVTAIAPGDSVLVSMWYTVAASVDGRVDTLYLDGRSVNNPATIDQGYAEVEVDSPATLLGRYWFNEAPEGQTPATVVDDQANPLNLTLTYDTPVEWTVDSIHRALGASTDVHTGIASASAVATKYTDSLEATSRATFVTVASFAGTGNTQRIGGFQTAGGTRVVTMLVLGDGRFTLRLATKTQPLVQVDWPNTWADGARRTFHFVYDADNAADSLRLRLYVDGVDQGPGTLSNGTWPAAGEGLDFSNGTLTLGLMNRATQDAGFGGNLHYYAVYAGQMTDAEISTNSTALLADDDNLTIAVAVTPDGAAVTRQAGSDYSHDFTVTNNGTGLDAFDLLGSTGPASSFITIDSITGTNVTQGAQADSARVTDVAASGAETVTVWYTVASSTGGRVDTLYLLARSISDTTVSDQGSLEVEFEAPAVALVRYWIDEAPSGQGVANLLDAEANPLNMPLNYPSTSTPIWDGGSGGNRHLSFDGTDGTDTGGGLVDVNGTKIDSIHGATNVTVEVKYMAEGCVGNDWRIFGISDGNSSTDGWLTVRERSLRDVLQVQWAGQTVGVYALETGCPITSASVVHWVVDTREATDSDRIRAYIDGVPATVTPIDASTWPSQNETIDLGPGTRRMFVGRPWDGIRTFRGRIWHAALYQGVLSDGQIASQATALTASDDNNTYAVAVTPDGQAVSRQAGTDYSEDFTVTNNSSVLEDFDLAARVAPAASFLTIDSITGTGVTQGATADSARVNGITASGTGTVTVWYTVASSTAGRVDTLFLEARSVSDTTQADEGSFEITFAVSVAVDPDGADTLQLLPTNAGASSSYKFTVTNGSAADETFDLLVLLGDAGATVLTLDSITGPNVSAGSADSARTGNIAGGASDSAFVWFSVADSAAGRLDSLYLMGRSVTQPAQVDSGWVFVQIVKPNIQVTKGVNPNGTQPPGTDLTYTVTVTNNGSADAVNVVTIDSLAVEVEFKVGTLVSNPPPAVSDSVEYSDDGGSTWTYTPISGGCSATAGYDRCVNRIRWLLLDDLTYVGPNNTGNFEFVARIR